MSRRLGRTRTALLTIVVAAVALAIAGCDGTGVTAQRLQRSLAPTFARLYVQQQLTLGNPRPDPRAIRTHAQCIKGTPSNVQQGAGNDWLCAVSYFAAGPGTEVTASYVVDVHTDGCYAADGDGPASLNGSRTITGPGYRQVPNPLWLIDGCFDTG